MRQTTSNKKLRRAGISGPNVSFGNIPAAHATQRVRHRRQQAETINDPLIDPHTEYAEGLRLAGERYFFSRNSKLTSDAKAHYGTKCQVCDLDFGQFYGPLGRVILSAITSIRQSERSEARMDGRAQNAARRCSHALRTNCHKLIHRRKAPRHVAGRVASSRIESAENGRRMPVIVASRQSRAWGLLSVRKARGVPIVVPMGRTIAETGGQWRNRNTLKIQHPHTLSYSGGQWRTLPDKQCKAGVQGSSP